jgi:hypothetical protein
MFGKLGGMLKDQAMSQLNSHLGGGGGGGGGGESAGQSTADAPAFGHINPNGKRKALFIGINYTGSSAALRGCWNDVKNVSAFVFKHGYTAQNSRFLTDEKADPAQLPTRKNIFEAFKWLIQGAQAGDALFLHYSGHGGSQPDTDGDEVDGMDETIVPVDYEKAGMIVDDEIYAILVKDIPAGVRLTAVFDSCHSGSVLDLCFSYKVDGNLDIIEIDNRKAAFGKAIEAGKHYLAGNKTGAFMSVRDGVQLLLKPPVQKEASVKAEKMRTVNADVVQFSGCRDDQTSADASIAGSATGAMSYALMEALNKSGGSLTFTGLLQELRGILHGKFSQVPQMSSGRRCNMNQPFDF